MSTTITKRPRFFVDVTEHRKVLTNGRHPHSVQDPMPLRDTNGEIVRDEFGEIVWDEVPVETLYEIHDEHWSEELPSKREMYDRARYYQRRFRGADVETRVERPIMARLDPKAPAKR